MTPHSLKLRGAGSISCSSNNWGGAMAQRILSTFNIYSGLCLIDNHLICLINKHFKAQSAQTFASFMKCQDQNFSATSTWYSACSMYHTSSACTCTREYMAAVDCTICISTSPDLSTFSIEPICGRVGNSSSWQYFVCFSYLLCIWQMRWFYFQ